MKRTYSQKMQSRLTILNESSTRDENLLNDQNSDQNDNQLHKVFIRMKRYGIYLIFISVVLFSACQKDLDIKIDNSYGDSLTWTLPSKAEGVLLKAYEGLMQFPDQWSGNNFLDVATDNAVTNDFGSGCYRIAMGGMNISDNPIGSWTNAYTQFQNIHLFLENGLGSNIKYSIILSPLDTVGFRMDSIKRVILKGESFFLRAWWGFDLLQKYGGLTNDGRALGYPIVTKSIKDADLATVRQMPRNTYEECVAQITADCDSAARLLPLGLEKDGIIGVTHLGRATSKAALALKSRVCLYAASPAYQTSASNVAEKWLRAAQAAQDALALLGSSGSYSTLVDANLAGPTLQSAIPDEFLLSVWSNSNTSENRQFPAMFMGQGKTNPSQNLVDAFPMLNGFPISDPRSLYDPNDPYKSRDKRLDLTVYYNGRMFNTVRPLEMWVDSIGTPGRDAAGYEYRNTRTGYYVRKWMSLKKNMLQDPVTLAAVNDYHQNPLLRRAEVHFNLAEALNEYAGPNGTVPGITLTAYSIMKSIRSANGITSTTYLDEVAALGKEAFRALIQNERRIEFAFENMRYFDMRRWLMPLNESVRGAKITKLSTGLVFQGTNPLETPIVVEKRLLNDSKFYYAPIPYEETIKNPNLVQNKGW